jgi:hypothetical protein
MTDRGEKLRGLAEQLKDEEGVRDAWVAKSFTDRLLVVVTPPDERLPSTVRLLLRSWNLRGYEEVYDLDGATDANFGGHTADGEWYRFVDVRDQGELQSYVVD